MYLVIKIHKDFSAPSGHDLIFIDNNKGFRPDFLYSLVYDNFFQRSNVGGRNKNKNKMSQNKDIT